MALAKTPARYASAAIVLHWLMALGLVAMVLLGWSMSGWVTDKAWQFWLIQVHKSLGVLLLLAVGARLAVRVAAARPPLPTGMAAREKLAARVGHGLLYGVMALLPLTGWLMVSASPYGLPTIVFGWFTWPHLPGVAGNATVAWLAEAVHSKLAWVLIALVALHVAAVAKHYWFDGDNLLRRMWWGKSNE